MRTRALTLTLALALAAGVLTIVSPVSASARACGPPCNIVTHNLATSMSIARSYAASHGGRLPTGRTFVLAILDVTAGLDPAVGGLAKARRLHDPAAVLVDPASTSKRLVLWGRAANGVVVSLTGTSKGGSTVHYGG